MNHYIEQRWVFFEGANGLRMLFLDSLTDTDLAFNPGGKNLTLGALCREMGEVEHSYLQSIKVFKQDWSYRNTEAGLDTHVAQLKAWFQAMDDDLKATIEAMSDEDTRKTIDRGTFQSPFELQLEFYLQAMFIFFGKAMIYLRAMNKAIPKDMEAWIG